MNEQDEVIVDFLRMLARIRKMFREAHIEAEKAPCFRSVGTTVSHGEKDLIENGNRKNAVEVSFSLDSELKQVTDGERYSLGVSVALYRVNSQWRVEGDVGWSCLKLGWDDIDYFEMTAETTEDLQQSLEPFVAKTLERYHRAIAEEENAKRG